MNSRNQNHPPTFPVMFGLNTFFAAQRALRDDGRLQGYCLRLAIRHRVVLGSGFAFMSNCMRMREKELRRSIGFAERRGLLDWGLVERLTDDQLERAAYMKMPRTAGKTLSEVQELKLAFWRAVMGDQCDS